MMKSSAALKNCIISLLAAACICALLASGILLSVDNAVNDALYLNEEALDGEVVVIGMDQYAIDRFGSMPWPRSIIAEALSVLNADPEVQPAAIGVDILFTSEGSDPEADAQIIKACEKGGNVIMASAATFGSELVTEEDSFYMDDRAVLAWDCAFPALAEVTTMAQINAMPDSDSFVRHALYSIDVPEYGTIRSFAREIYEQYCEFHGLAANPEPRTSDDFFYLPYTAKPGSFYDGISVADLLDGLVDPDYYAGKIVLIGPYAAGMQDEYKTSIDHGEPMYGIEIQANQIEAYRNGFNPVEASRWVQLIVVFLLAAACFYLFMDAKMQYVVIAWLFLSAGWIAAALLLYRSGVIVNALWGPLAFTLMFLLTFGSHYVRAQMEKRRITDTFGKYVDPAILKELLESGTPVEDMGGKEYDIAVLFVDIRGFTTMSESLEPKTVVEILNSYLSLTTECVMRYHGTLDKFVGDCTMAFWNAPLPQDDAVYLACCAARDMVIEAGRLGAELEKKYGKTVGFGVGVHYGPAVVGNIGSAKRMDYTAIGDTVNTASRLESNAPAGKIYISRAVADELGDRAVTTSLGGSVRLKGKTEGFEVLTLDSLS